MKYKSYLLLLTLLFVSFGIKAQDKSKEYIKNWKAFYPSRALASGMHDAVFNYENPTLKNINEWLDFNRMMLEETSKSTANGRLLRVQMQSEIHKWTKEQPHLNTLSFYTGLLTSAISSIENVDFLTQLEKSNLICDRLTAMRKISDLARINLKRVRTGESKRALVQLRSLIRYLEVDLMNSREKRHYDCDILGRSLNLSESIKSLVDHVNIKLVPLAKSTSPILGKPEYTRRLALYTDSKLTPDALAEMALKEISEVRTLMGNVSKEYLSSQYPNQPLPNSLEELTKAALADMEKDAPMNAQDYLDFWLKLAEKAVTFIDENNIATLPKNNTLEIKTAPESAGASARIGWVSSAPPFDPNPITTLYLPSIPETLPEQEQIDFWASFNKPFNRMIVIHELLPGHYMQMKISKETPHPIRLLFPYGIYTEGWATFTERVLLDAGWEEGQHLTMLAHLRKRMENANRAYTSVQVHTNGWTEAQVTEFSTKTALVAPQFAKSLWGRIMSSPMQLTSYFLGGAQFSALLKTEKERIGSRFNLKLFMDTIMKSGPIPIDAFYGIFEQTIPKR